MNGLIQELTTELKSNPGVNNSVAVRVVLESIHNSVLLGVPSDQILENSLNTLEELATATVNENLKEVVAKFKKLAEKPTKRLHDMAREAGLSMKIKALKESAISADPTFKFTVARLEQNLAVLPEFRVIGTAMADLGKYSYDATVASALSDLSAYVSENRAKLEIMNAIFEMRQTGAILYKDSIIDLENSLLDNIYESDSIRMKMRGRKDLPIVTRLLNTLSMVEAKNHGKFSIGIGNGEARVKPVIGPFYKVSESEAIVFVDNKFIKFSEDADPAQMTQEEVAEYPEFVSVCETFANLGFTERENEIVSRGRRLEVAFAVNEAGNLYLKINGNTINDLTKVNVNELFLMEELTARSLYSKLFNSLDSVVNLEFAKKIVNERLDRDSIVFTVGESLYVFEKIGNSRLFKKMEGLAFHNYVMENFNYDVSELYSIELEERDAELRRLDTEKVKVEEDLSKLEGAIQQLEEALKDSSISEEYHSQLDDLKVSIEKNVNSLKSYYISLDQTKKKL